MKKQKTVKQDGSQNPSEAASPEAVAFENLVKQVLKVSKTELDAREAEYKRARKRR